MRRLFAGVFFTCMLSGAAHIQACAAESLSFDSVSKPSEYLVRYKGKPVMAYSFDAQKFKPYVKALHPIGGENILRDAPFDHLHHHALMYGIRVNGLNFWEEISGSGVQRTVEIRLPSIDQRADGNPQASIDHLIHWIAPGDAFLPATNTVALLVEQRTLKLVVNEPAREVALRWRSLFQVGGKTNTVNLSGSNYHGLGMRFRQHMDAIASHFTASGRPDLDGSKQDVSQHPWEAVSFAKGTESVTVALFGHPKNARGNAHFFSMRTPFAYLSATQGLDKEPLVYRSGEKFEINYLVTVYSEAKDAGALSSRAQQWEKSGM